jgi:predicted RecA/RadA family phage recombinase
VLQGLFRHLRSNVVAYVALFVAFGAGAYAASDKAPKNSVVSKSIKNGQVKQKDIGKDAVGSDQITDGSVKTGEIGDGAVGAADLGAGAVTAAKLAPGTIDAGDGVVVSERLAIDDPAAAGGTTVPLLTSGPFSLRVVCTEVSASQASLAMEIQTTEAAYVLENSLNNGTDFVEPNTPTPLTGTVNNNSPNNSLAGPSVYALSQDGDSLSLGTMVTVKPSNSSVDCLVHGSGIAG